MKTSNSTITKNWIPAIISGKFLRQSVENGQLIHIAEVAIGEKDKPRSLLITRSYDELNVNEDDFTCHTVIRTVGSSQSLFVDRTGRICTIANVSIVSVNPQVDLNFLVVHYPEEAELAITQFGTAGETRDKLLNRLSGFGS